MQRISWFLFVACVGCRFDVAPSPQAAARLEFQHASLKIAFEDPADLQLVRILDPHGQLLQELPTVGQRREYTLPFAWEPNQPYLIELHFAEGPPQQQSLASPDQSPFAAVVVHVPFGQESIAFSDHREATVVVPATGRIPLGVTVENQRQQPVQFEFRLNLPDGVSFRGDDARWKPGESAPQWLFHGGIDLEFEIQQAIGELQVAPGVREATIECFARCMADEEAPREHRLTLHLRAASRQELAAALTVTEVAFPADSQGQRRAEQLSDAIVLPNPVWNGVRRLFRSSSTMFNYYDAYGYQSVSLQNYGQAPLNLLIESEVIDVATGTPLISFAPPEWKSPRSSATSQHLLRVGGGQTAQASIPLYVRPEVQIGQYQRRLRIFLVGDQQPLLTIDRPLVVQRGDPLVSAVVLASLLVSVVGWGIIAWSGRRVVRGIGVDGLVTIALIAALHFVVSYVARVGGDVLAGVLGPLAVFVAGIGNEGLTCLLVATAVTMIPRVGVFALSSLTVFLLNVLFTGQIGLVDLLFVTVSMVMGEACLVVLGITNGGRVLLPNRDRTGQGDRPTSIIVRTGLALGIANLATLYAQFCLIQVLQRLYFATWYVASVAVITGLIFGGIGAAFGTRLGLELRRTAR